ncbi:hypothetical protein JZU57_00695, partial [bacterium]|nr:hypothetical protein [bacterium]
MNIQSISTSLPLQQSSPEASVIAREPRAVASPAQEKVQQPVQAVSQEQLKAAVENVQAYIKPFNNN